MEWRKKNAFWGVTWNVAGDVNADDHSRIRLERSSLDYINASIVVAGEAERSYILTQVSHISIHKQDLTVK